MRLKTFLAAYALFLCILFASVGIVSVYMTNSTTHMLQEKGAREFHAIIRLLSLDMAAIYARFPGGREFHMAVDQLFDVYMLHYRRNNIGLTLAYNPDIYENGYALLTFKQESGSHYLAVTGALPYPFAGFRLSYLLDITNNINDMQQIQQFLWIISIVVSLVAAVFLYAILLKIFKPLEIVAQASLQIADGRYSERIAIKGKNELATMATAFNSMAMQIQSQITQLEDEANKKQQFVDNFAHEIRTPLTSIYGYAEYLQKASINETELIESTGYIMSEANHMKDVANSLLELATLRDYKPNPLPIYIPELFEDIKKSLESRLASAKAELNCHTHAYSLTAQQDLIKSMLLNLCTNAIAACDKEGGIITLEAEKEDSQIILTVTDNGSGIPKDALPKVTEPFFRVDKARSRSGGGVGLGLALCKQIAQVHNADMQISSVPGQGTTVKIIFTAP